MATALTERQASAVKQVRDVIAHNIAKVRAAAPKHLDANQLAGFLLQTIEGDPKLLQCTADSLFSALLESTRFGLSVGKGVMAEAYIVPFSDRKNNITIATLIPGYRGLRKLARQAGWQIVLEAVHEGDAWEYRGKLDLPMHSPSNLGDRRFLPVMAAYLVGKDLHNPSAMPVVNAWTVGECMAHRDRYSIGWQAASSKKNGGPDGKSAKESVWHPENPAFRVMCMKTVLRDSIARGEITVSNSYIRNMLNREDNAVDGVVVNKREQITVEDPPEDPPKSAAFQELTDDSVDPVKLTKEFGELVKQCESIGSVNELLTEYGEQAPDDDCYNGLVRMAEKRSDFLRAQRSKRKGAENE